ncbi:unnamed protein product [Urochloa humidicola]
MGTHHVCRSGLAWVERVAGRAGGAYSQVERMTRQGLRSQRSDRASGACPGREDCGARRCSSFPTPVAPAGRRQLPPLRWARPGGMARLGAGRVVVPVTGRSCTALAGWSRGRAERSAELRRVRPGPVS